MVSQFVFGSGLFLLKEVSRRRQRREGRGHKLQVTCGRHLPWQPPLEPHYLQGSRSYQRREPPKKKRTRLLGTEVERKALAECTSGAQHHLCSLLKHLGSCSTNRSARLYLVTSQDTRSSPPLRCSLKIFSFNTGTKIHLLVTFIHCTTFPFPFKHN